MIRHHLVLLSLVSLLLGAIMVSGCMSGQPAPLETIAVPVGCLTYYTEQMPPYNYAENGTLKGFAVDLLELITERTGDRASRDQVRLVPWSEGYQAALTGNRTVIFAIARNPARDASFKWAGPVGSVQEVLFARGDSGIVIRKAGDLKQYRIGAVADDLAVQQLTDAGVSRESLVLAQNATDLAKKLRDREIDLWAYPEPVGRYFTKTVTGNPYTFSVAWRFPEVPIYYAFSRDVPDATVQSFQRGLDALKAEKDAVGVSTYDRVLGKYIPATGLGQLQYLTEEWAPYNYAEKGNVTGISVDILEAVFRTIGVNRTRADVRIVPLAEGFRQTQNRRTVLFSIVRTPEREPLYQWAGPFTRSGFVVYAPVKKNITITSDADLGKYRIAAVRSTIENDLLDSRGVKASRIVPGEDPADCLRLLEEGQADLWATGDRAGRHQMLKTAADPNAYEIVYPLNEYDFYYIFSKDVPEPLVTAFQEGLVAVRTLKDAKGISEYERILYRYLGVGCTKKPFPDDAVIILVNKTAAAIEQNASGTLSRINAGEAPYRDPWSPSLYVFVYDENTTIVAHADNPAIVGINHRGMTDVAGNPFHDTIVAGAKANGSGWVTYVAMNPTETNLYTKTTHYRRATGSDGRTYIVASGNYMGCKG